MKIEDVRTYLVGTPAPHKGGFNWVFLKLITNEGVEGFGECCAPVFREHTLVTLINELGRKFVIGSDPFQIEKLFHTLYTGVHQFRHPGIITAQVTSAFEIACWDIVGKTLKQPIYNLLGGRFNDKLRSYTYMPSDSGTPTKLQSPDKAGQSAASLVKEGFTALKFDPIQPIAPAPRELSLGELHYAEDVVRSIREAVGDKCDILIGTHGQLNTHSAIRFAKMLEKYDPLWFEEPVPLENVDEMARVAQHTSIPIATGERLCTKHEFRTLLEKKAAQIIQVNLGFNGILESKKIAAMCDAYYAQIAPWMYCGPVAGAAAIQLDVCSPNFLIQEGLEKWAGFHAEILKDPIKWENGYLIPSTKAGLGVELNEDVLEKHPYVQYQYDVKTGEEIDLQTTDANGGFGTE